MPPDNQFPGFSDRERLARLEEAMTTMKTQMDSVQGDVSSIRSSLDQMTGGRKALLGLFALVGAVAGIIGALVKSIWPIH